MKHTSSLFYSSTDFFSHLTIKWIITEKWTQLPETATFSTVDVLCLLLCWQAACCCCKKVFTGPQHKIRALCDFTKGPFHSGKGNEFWRFWYLFHLPERKKKSYHVIGIQKNGTRIVTPSYSSTHACARTQSLLICIYILAPSSLTFTTRVKKWGGKQRLHLFPDRLLPTCLLR